MKREMHGLRKHPLYDVWHDMKARCYNKNNKAHYCYGGRGIEVCPEWLNSFKSFYDWAMDNEYKKGLEVDRRDNDLGYSPENCRFVTRKCNLRNTRRSKWWFINNVRYESSGQAAKELGVGRTTIKNWCNGELNKGRYYPPKPNCYSELKYNPT